MISCHGSIRFDNDELCGVLFGWADAKLELVAEAYPIDKGWVREVQGRRGLGLSTFRVAAAKGSALTVYVRAPAFGAGGSLLGLAHC